MRKDAIHSLFDRADTQVRPYKIHIIFVGGDLESKNGRLFQPPVWMTKSNHFLFGTAFVGLLLAVYDAPAREIIG